MTVLDIVGWLAQTSLVVTLLIVLVLLIRKPIARLFGANAAYALWLAPAIRIFLPELKFLPNPNTIQDMTSINYSWAIDANTFTTSALPSHFDLASLIAAVILIIWAMVAVAWFNIKLESQNKFRRDRLAVSKHISSALSDEADKIAKQFRLKHKPIIRISDDTTGPCLIGLFRPVIFLPHGFEKNYTNAERRLALAHEMAHIARGDMAFTYAAFVLQALQWPNPFVHLAFRAFRADQEAACDAYVLARYANSANSAGEYAAAILKSVRAGASPSGYGLYLAHPVKERMMLLKNLKKSPLRVLTGAVFVTIFTAGCLGATANYGYAEEKYNAEAAVTKVKKKYVVMSADGTNVNKTVEIITDGEDEMGFDIRIIADEDVFIDEGDGKRHIRVFNLHEATNGEHRMSWFGPHKEGDMRAMHMMNCSSDEESDSAPFIMEWNSDDSDDGENTRSMNIICLTGDDADPETRADALRKAISHMEESAKKQTAQREKMIANMRKKIRELEEQKKD